MKKIKVFSAVLAIGLGLTATFAFKAHKTADETLVPASYYYDAGGLELRNVQVVSATGYSCDGTPNILCDIVYDGTVTITGGNATIPPADYSKIVSSGVGNVTIF